MKGKVVIITGGTSGIGRALAFAYGKAGAKIVFTGRNEERLRETASALLQAGISNHGVIADASKEDDNRRMVDECIKHFDRVDILINNAGISMRALFNNVDLEVMEQVMGINFYGTVYATKFALPHLLKSKGSIIGISSIAGYRGLPARTAYSSSKFAMQGFLEALRTELLKTGVHVMVACPGFTSSNIRNTALGADGKAQKESPLDEGKIMSAEEVAEGILKANLKRKRTILFTSQGKMTVLLNKLFPKFMDKMVYKHFENEPNSPLKNQ